MSDIRDILGAGRVEKSEVVVKEKKEKAKRPEGMSREAFALLGDQHPIMASHIPIGSNSGMLKKTDLMKPKHTSKATPTYQYLAFRNSARTDDLRLKHWIKTYREPNGNLQDQEDSEYHFAKFNTKVHMYKYDDEEYKSLIQADSAGWTRNETDYLFHLCELFDLRFPIIADRYSPPQSSSAHPLPPRTAEDLKERYYAISRKLLVAREGGEASVANNALVRHPFNRGQEVERKRALEALLCRTVEQAAEESAILAEAKLIEDRRKPEPTGPARRVGTPGVGGFPGGRGVSPAPPRSPTAGAAGVDGAAVCALFSAADRRFPQDFSNDPGPGVPSLFDIDVNPAKQPRPGVVARGLHAQHTAAAMTAAMAGGRQGAEDLSGPGVNTRATVGTWLALRAEVIALHELRRNLGQRFGDEARAPKKADKKKK
ncbi:MAG: hypothetical protein WDW36_009098 [Sanguina aurantia]